MSKKNILLVTILALAMIVLGVVIWNFWGRAPVEPPGKTAVTFAEGSTIGICFPITGRIVEIWNTYLPDISATRELTPGGVGKSLRDISEGKYDFRWAGSNVAYFCYKGIKMGCAKGKSMESLRAIGSFWGHMVQIITKADSPINDISDLRNKSSIKVAVLKKRQLSVVTEEILGIYGIPSDKVETIEMPLNKIAETLKAGNADIAIVGFSLLSEQETSILKEETELKFLALSEDIIEKLKKKFPYYTDGLIPANTYPNQSNDVKGIVIRTVVVCREDIDSDLVYKLTKAIFDHLDEIKIITPVAGEMSLEKALEGLAIPLHPGAERYYSEVGILK